MDSMSCMAYLSAMGLIHDGFTKKSQKVTRAVLAKAAASRITAVLSGLTKTSHHGSGQGLPQIVSTMSVQDIKVRMTAIVPPIGRRPHKLRLKP